jgi:hypothetical protein
MRAPNELTTGSAPASLRNRRFAAVVILGVLVFLVLRLMGVSSVASMLYALGFRIVVVAACTTTVTVLEKLDGIAAVPFIVLGAIVAVFAFISGN